MSAKQRKKFDALVSRILFFELAIAAIAVGVLVFTANPITETITIILGGSFTAAGLFVFIPALS